VVLQLPVNFSFKARKLLLHASFQILRLRFHREID
ncbi:unnamed protein product, partial [Brassica rapa subsp. trilocularis]